MSAPAKRGLGRGLGALLGDSPLPTSPTASTQRDHSREHAREIPLASIVPNPHQPRKHFAQEALAELAASIEQLGVIIPILVRARGERYEIIAGERRWRASAVAGKAVIPAIVRTSDDRESLELAIVENLQREDLNPLEEAMGFAHLLEEYALSQEQLATRMGKSRPAIANALRLLSLEDEIKAMLADGRLSAGHGRALLALPSQQRRDVAVRIVNDGLSVRAVERLASDAASATVQKAPEKHEPALAPDERDFESRLRERFGVRVDYKRSGKGGTITFRCANRDELLALGDALLDPS
ncbi:MAG: ParB/RepB/Spo0J family partition protein [Vulcanimicrobiaceae bacterium]